MPINPIVLQRRHAELGRIRLGNQVPTNNGRTRPNKLDKFRFTSASEQHIHDLATIYGGEARAWDNNGKAEWEVFTDAQSMPVIVVKGGLSQWMETWSGGGCVHRCDGQVNTLTNEACNPNDPAHADAKPTTRLSVMLPDLEAIGVWRMESHGWNAAAEIPAIAELAQFVGDLVPAVLHLMERRSVRDGKTSRFVVPVLDLRIGQARLREIVNEKAGLELAGPGATKQLEQGGPAGLPAGSSVPDYFAQAQDASSLETVQAIWHKARDAGHMTDELNAQLNQIGNSLKNAVDAQQGPDEDGAYEAEIVDEAAVAAADVAWQRVLAAAGKQGMDLPQTMEAFAEFSQGIQADDGTAEQFDAFHALLTGGQQVPA